MSTPTRQLPHSTAPSKARRNQFVGLTITVALAHWALLSGMPLEMQTWHDGEAPQPVVFSVRTVAPLTRDVDAAKPPPAASRPAARAPGYANTPADTAAAQAQQLTQETQPSATNQARPDTTDSATDAPPPDAVAIAPNPQETEGQETTSQALVPPILQLPPSVRLGYDVQGVVKYAYTGGSELVWLNQGPTYSARLVITKFGFNLRTWTSRGDITPQGLAPLRFGDKTRSEVAAHFQRDKGIVSFSANTPDATLLIGAQDYLSSFFQLAGMLAGEPDRYPAGSQVAFQVVNARSAEPWTFHIEGQQPVALPDGPKEAIKLTREHDAQYDTKVELWLAPELHYVPVRIRLSQGNGDYAELLWRSTANPL